MRQKTKPRIFWVGILIYLIVPVNSFAQNNTWELWTGATVSKKMTGRFKISINPEFRFAEQFDHKEWRLETGVDYLPFQFLELGINYRFSSSHEPDGDKTNSHTFSSDVRFKYPIQRFKIEARGRFTNYNEFGEPMDFKNPYLRYRLKMEYDLPNSKLRPMTSVEWFHQLSEHEINKIRYSVGVDYRFNKKHALGATYHYQDYLKKERYRNMVELSYKFKFN